MQFSGVCLTDLQAFHESLKKDNCVIGCREIRASKEFQNLDRRFEEGTGTATFATRKT